MGGGRTARYQACRIEWGPSQRSCLGAKELRIRGPLATPASLQMLAMTANMANALEMDAYRNARDDPARGAWTRNLRGGPLAGCAAARERVRPVRSRPQRSRLSGQSCVGRSGVAGRGRCATAGAGTCGGASRQHEGAGGGPPRPIDSSARRGGAGSLSIGVGSCLLCAGPPAATQAAEHLFEGGEWSTTASATWVQSSLPNRGQVAH